MTTRPPLAVLCALLGCTLIVTLGARRLAHARSTFEEAVERYRTVQHDAEIVQRLRAQEERISLRARPTDDVIALVSRALAEAGLPGDRLADLRNESDAALSAAADAPPYRKQSIAFTLRSMTPGELGAFLIAWRKSQSVWSATRITIASPRSRGGGEEGRFDVGLVVSAVYLGEL